MTGILKDMRYAARTLGKTPAFTLVAVLSLALGIGANTAIFSLVDGLWFRPMAVPRPGEIVRLFSLTEQDRRGLLSFPEYVELQNQTTAFRGLAACGRRGIRMADADGTLELLTVNVVSENFFQVLGVHALLGRTFTSEGARALWQQPVVVLGNSFWKRRFGGDPAIAGKQIELKRDTSVLFTVLGVLPASFREIETASDRDLWLPPQSWTRLAGRSDFEERGFRWFNVVGRLSSSVFVPSATAQVRTMARRLAADWPATNAGRGIAVVSDLRYRMEQAGTNGVLLLCVVLLVVLLCSVNVANLLVARNASRGHEVAIRLALGANRFRVVRQLMAENCLLGLGGLTVGLILGSALIQSIPNLLVAPPGFPVPMDFQLDTRVLLFTLLVSTITIVLFGLTPAWGASRPELVPALKREASLNGGSHRLGVRQLLVIAQVSVSLTLLIATGVLVRSFVNTRTSDYGLARKELLTAFVSWSGERGQILYREAMERMRSLPGVKAVAVATRAPLSLSENGIFQRVGFPEGLETRNQPPVEIKYNAISSNFLPVMGTAVRRGRGFNDVDQSTGAPVVLINEQMAQRYWPGQDPIGKTIYIEGAPAREHRIVGVVQNAPINAIGEQPEPYLYLPFWKNPTAQITFVIEPGRPALTLAQAVRQQLIQLDRRLDPLMMSSEEQLMRYSTGRYQITAELVAGLGVVGLVLTAIGLYGVISYGVSRRTREIGIRMALGAERGEMLALILREAMKLALIGMALGLPMALTTTRLASTMLFGIGPWDIPTFLGAGVLLMAVLVAAGWLPAQRATRIEPVTALRSE